MKRQGMANREELSRLLDIAITESGLTYAEITRLTGLKERHLRRLRRGESAVKSIPKILETLGWEVEEVVIYRAPAA